MLGAGAAVGPDRARAQAATGPQGRYEEIEVADGGVIRGRVTFSGPPPALTLFVTQDRALCSHGVAEIPSHRLRVGPEGGLADAVIRIQAIARGKPLARLGDTFRLDQRGCRYEPFVQVAPFRGTLTIVNSDPINHNVNGKLDGTRQIFNYAMPTLNQAIPVRLIRGDGAVWINCDVHPWMSAFIWVARHPYYAVTGDDGVFELTDVPPGNHVIELWRPGWRGMLKRNPQGQPIGYEFEPPIVRTASVELAPGGVATVDFVISAE